MARRLVRLLSSPQRCVASLLVIKQRNICNLNLIFSHSFILLHGPCLANPAPIQAHPGPSWPPSWQLSLEPAFQPISHLPLSFPLPSFRFFLRLPLSPLPLRKCSVLVPGPGRTDRFQLGIVPDPMRSKHDQGLSCAVVSSWLLWSWGLAELIASYARACWLVVAFLTVPFVRFSVASRLFCFSPLFRLFLVFFPVLPFLPLPPRPLSLVCPSHVFLFSSPLPFSRSFSPIALFEPSSLSPSPRPGPSPVSLSPFSPSCPPLSSAFSSPPLPLRCWHSRP